MLAKYISNAIRYPQVFGNHFSHLTKTEKPSII